MVTDFLSQDAAVKIGDILEGRYRVLKALGTGSIGSVYLAEHVLIKRRVAIKILRPELGDAARLDGFMAEARAAGTLGHRNIVECTDMGATAAGVPYLALEYLEGALLSDEIHRLGGLPLARALDIADQIAAALRAAHDIDIVHRDLTSDNVFLIDRAEGRDLVKVVDFGVSRFRTVPGARRRPGLPVGTLEYMAPEQLTGPDIVDGRSDIYALGVILYEMLTGRQPFTDDDRRLLLHRVIHEPAPMLMQPDAPRGLEEMIIARMLAKDPDDRYGSMAEVQNALEAFASSPQPSVPVSRERENVSEREEQTNPALPAADLRTLSAAAFAMPAPAKRRSLQLGWLVAAVLAAAAGAGVIFIEDETRSTAAQATSAALDGDAEKLASLIDSEVRAAQLRADGVATLPMLRAAIETDAATLRDMAGSDFIFSPRGGEVLEVFQFRDRGDSVSLLRIPSDAPPIPVIAGNQTRIASDGEKLTIVVGAPVVKRQAGVGGTVAILVPLDLAQIQKRIGEHTRSAILVGLGAPIQLFGGSVGATALTLPVPLSSDLGIGKVALTVAAPPLQEMHSELRVVRLGCWGLGGLMVVLFTASLLRGRKPE